MNKKVPEVMKKIKKEKKKNEKPEEFRSFFLYPEYKNPQFIFEEIYKNNVAKFIRYDIEKDEFEELDFFETDEKIYRPISGDEIIKGVVTLPQGIKEYDSIIELDKKIRKFVNSWLDIDKNYLKYVSWNVRFSWVYDKFHTLNYTRALGDTGTGKSRFLDTIGRISYKPMIVSGALTPAPIFRIIDKWKGTLLIDEGDQKNSNETDAFIKILNCGYERGRSIMRCDTLDANILRFYDVYCPKVITTRKRFTDKATETRCMTKIMVQTFREDIPETLTKAFFEEAEEIRQMLLYYRLKNYMKINSEEGFKVDLSNIEPRLRQVNRGFIGMFSNDKEQIEEFKKYIIEYQREIIEDRAESFDGSIINSLAELIVLGHEYITPKMISDYLNENYPQKYQTEVRVIGKHLKSLGLKFQRKKIEGSTKNILLQDDKKVPNNVFSRYIIDENLKNELNKKGYVVSSVTYPISHPEPYVTKGKVTCTRDVHIQRNKRNHHNPNHHDTSIFDKKNKKNDMNRLKKLLKLIEEVSIYDLITSQNFTDEFIDKLLKQGILFESKKGHVRLL